MRKNGIERNITCPLCHGYLIDAVTLQECTHFFCRRCFLLHLQREKTCPQCSIRLTDLKTAFFRDDVLQNLIYKLTPATYWREVELRADFIEKRVVTAEERRQIADLNLIQFQQHLIEKDELVEFCMAYITPEQLVEGNFDEEQPPPPGHEGEVGAYYKKYFRCKALVPLEDLKEILLAQVDLPENVIIAFIHEGSREVLLDKYTLQDVVYLFGWDRQSSLQLYFTAMDAQRPVAEDEEQPPVLEMECSFDQRDESMKSPPPLEQPEERVNMFPALTVNLSTAQCIPDMTLNGGTGTRIPIITQASQPAAKKRRRTGPKKEKAKKINSKQPIAPTSNNVVPPASTVSRESSVEWLTGTSKTPQQLLGSPLVNSTNMASTASRPASTTSNLSMPSAAAPSPLSKPSSSTPNISKTTPPMSVASMLSPSPASSKSPQPVPTTSSQGPSSSTFAKPDPPMSVASLLSPSCPSSSKASPMPSLSKQMFQNPLAAQLTKGTLIGIAPERKSFFPTAPEPCFAMPRLSSAISAMGSKQTESTPPPMQRFSMPLLSLPESTSASANMTTSNHLMSTKMAAMSALSKPGFMPSTNMAATLNSLFPMQSNPQLNMPKLSSKPKPSMPLPLNLNPPMLSMASELNPPTLSKAVQSTSSMEVDSPPPPLMQMESSPSSSKSVPPQPSQPTFAMPVLSRQLSNDPPPKRSSLMPTFSMPPLSSTSASSMAIPPKTSSPLSNPMVAPLKSSKPTSYKMMPTSMKASSSVNPKPYEKQAPKKKSTLSANGKEKSATRSPRPFVMPRSQSPDVRAPPPAPQQIQKSPETTPAIPSSSTTAATASNKTAETTNVNNPDNGNHSNTNNNDLPQTRPVPHWDQPKKREFIPFALRKEAKPKPILMKGETTPVVIPPWPFNKDAPRPTLKAKPSTNAADEPSTKDADKTPTSPAVKSPTIRSPTRPSPIKQRPNTSSLNKGWNSPSKNIGSSLIPIMTDRVPLMMASKAGR